MLKKAIYFFALSSLLLSCSTQISYPPSFSLPVYEPPPSQDLTASDPFLIDGEIELAEKQKGESAEIQKIEFGADREEKRVSTTEVPPIPVLVPDITITTLFLNRQRRLVILLANIGNGPFPMEAGNLKVMMDGQLKGVYPLSSLSDQPILQEGKDLIFTTPFNIVGRHEIHAYVDIAPETVESNRENNGLKKTLMGPPIGPDIVVKELDLSEDLELSILLSNEGEVDLRKGVTFRIRIFVNDRKVSEFEHFTAEALKANLGNSYPVDPPYRVGISGMSKVKVSVSPKAPSDDICLENNILERIFIIFPFRIGPQAKEEFSFSISPVRHPISSRTEKVKVEARWEGGGSPLTLSFSRTGQSKTFPAISGKGPLKIEFPITPEEVQRGSLWKVSATNLLGKKVEGQLIIQHP